MKTRGWLVMFPVLPTLVIGAPAAESRTKATELPVIERFESFGAKDGILSHKVHCVLPSSDGKLWVGTYKGVVLREDGKFRTIGTDAGLTHPMVLCMVEDPTRGDMWVGTMRGLNRFSGGRITTYTQTSSGLPNNVVYGVDIVKDTLWTATAAGLGALDLKSGTWTLYDHSNTTMHEPWVYAVKGTKDRLFVGVWGGGILEYDPERKIFKEHRDPDMDFHLDLFPDDGPVNDITSWVAWDDDILWQATYFGLSRYDGSRWRTWQELKSPLVSNFINFVWAQGRIAWIGTDQGVSVTDGTSWVNYRPGDATGGVMEIHKPGVPMERHEMESRLPNYFVLGIWANEKEAWFATSDGLGHGIVRRPSGSTTASALR